MLDLIGSCTEHFPYAVLEFHGDPKLALPLEEAWGGMGKSFSFFNI